MPGRSCSTSAIRSLLLVTVFHLVSITPTRPVSVPIIMYCHLPVRCDGLPVNGTPYLGSLVAISYLPVIAKPGATSGPTALVVSLMNALPCGAPVVPFSQVYTLAGAVS